MRNLLLAWYDENKRELPWRAAASAYHVWISEVMLQQTRAEAVKGYYTRFLAALPDTAALAAVDDDRLLKLWEGLGYYTRARCMKKAARIVMDEYGGALPASPEALLRLPGIGLYTAGAIASIAYGIPVPAVDGNVLRVLMRLHAQYDDITLEATRKETARRLLELIPRDRPGDFNQSLMELGAVVCLPNGAPRCAACPLAWHCLAHTQKLTAQLPVRAAKKARRVERRAVLILRHEGRTALRKRGSRGLLAGFWELPNALEDWPSLARELGVAP
ncbi:MAG: A/G-specific adenine glycosylase, partial [Oscillospiraceae bacterium]|nr:A/G-specific adenine glycosylase [Oscillospiraceae bacterium]